MKKVLFDLCATQPNKSGKRHGGGIYGETILERIVEKKLAVAVFYDSSKWLNPKIEGLLLKNKIASYDIQENSLQSIIDTHKIDILYTPLIQNYIDGLKNCQIKATEHGLRYVELPLDIYRFKYRKELNLKEVVRFVLRKCFPQMMLNRCKHLWEKRLAKGYDLVTVSEHSAYSLMTFLPTLGRIEVFYSPLHYIEEENADTNKEGYFLLVSANRWEKNNYRAIVALDRLFSQGFLEGHNVIITGANSIRDFRYELKKPERFDFKGYVSDAELKCLYKHAFCLVYPSLNEGFGYPPLEAMQYGTPIIASPFSSIPEICGDAVLYFNPFSIEEIMNRMLMICDKEKYATLAAKGKQRFEIIKKRQDEDLDKLINYIYEMPKSII